MPRHLIVDAHEWINEASIVLIGILANSQLWERAQMSSAGKEDPFELDASLTL